MAGASQKKIAARNKQVLNSVHFISAVVNAASLLAIFVFGRPANYYPYIIFNAISVFFEYTLERSGRKDKGKKVDDLGSPGLTEYMFDVFYLTCFLDLLMIAFGSNKVWLLMLVVPVFGAYKSFWLVQMLFGFLKSRRGGSAATQPAGNGEFAAANEAAPGSRRAASSAKASARRRKT